MNSRHRQLLLFPHRAFGYRAVTAEYAQRKTMHRLVEQMEEARNYAHLSLPRRIRLFFMEKKRRFFYVFLLFMTFHYWSRVSMWVSARIERTSKKYRKRWIYRFQPTIIVYPTALETL